MDLKSMWPRRALAVCGVLLLLSACGGGGGGSAPTPVPTPTPATALPDLVTVSAPGTAEPAAELQFGNSVSGLGGLTFAWDFGDGATSTEASPKHAYAKPGDFVVKFKVTNAAGVSRDATQAVTVNSLAHVRGLNCTAANSGGWCWQSPRVAVRLAAPALLDPRLAWAVGVEGGLYQTTDGGGNWASKFSVPSTAFVQVAFADSLTGMALAKDGALHTTADGGAQWTSKGAIESLNPANISEQSLQLLDARRVLVRRTVNGVDYAMLSTDGGATWGRLSSRIDTARSSGVFWGEKGRYANFGQTYVPYGPASIVPGVNTYTFNPGAVVAFDDLTAVREQTGYVMPDTNRSLLLAVYRTTNGGQTWTSIVVTEPAVREGFSQYSPFAGRTLYYPTLLRPASSQVLWALTGAAWRSVDGGATWSQAPATANAPSGISVDAWADTGNPLRLLAVYRKFGESLGVLHETTDGGQTWTRAGLSDLGIGVTRIVSAQAGRVVVEANNGALFQRDDSTGRWERLANSDDLGAITGFGFWDEQPKKGLAITDTSGLLSTDDGGRNWRALEVGEVPPPWLTKYRGSRLQVLGAKAWMARNGKLLFSDNRGVSWAEKGRTAFGNATNATVDAMHFRDADMGDVVLGSGQVWRTADGGATWAATGKVPYAGEIQFATDQLGLVNIDQGGISVTRDGGTTWANVSIPTAQFYFKRMLMVDANQWWVVGHLASPVVGYVHVTRDGGATWTEHKLPGRAWPALRAVGVSADGQPWLAGDGGALFTSTDLGKTWQDRSIPGASLSAVHFNSSKTGWLGGTRGEVVSTGTGGR